MIWLILTAAPSLVVAYLMICRLNSKTWGITSLEAWSYVILLGGAIYTCHVSFYGYPPTMGKLLMDIGVCLYFGFNSWRIGRIKQRHPHKPAV